MAPHPMTDADILRLLARKATRASCDPRTQNAAALARRDDLIISAANAVPAGLARQPGRMEPPGKYVFVEHAERNVIYKAASMGWMSGGSTMYALWFACPDCARAIIQAGIYEVVGHTAPRAATPARWSESVRAGEEMLREAGVGMRWISASLGVSILFDGKEMSL